MAHKTCEERILWELEETEGQLADKKLELIEMDKRYSKVLSDLEELKKIIREIAVYNIYSNRNSYISFHPIWENWDDDRIEKLLKLVPGIKRKEVLEFEAK